MLFPYKFLYKHRKLRSKTNQINYSTTKKKFAVFFFQCLQSTCCVNKKYEKNTLFSNRSCLVSVCIRVCSNFFCAQLKAFFMVSWALGYWGSTIIFLTFSPFPYPKHSRTQPPTPPPHTHTRTQTHTLKIFTWIVFD